MSAVSFTSATSLFRHIPEIVRPVGPNMRNLRMHLVTDWANERAGTASISSPACSALLRRTHCIVAPRRTAPSRWKIRQLQDGGVQFDHRFSRHGRLPFVIVEPINCQPSSSASWDTRSIGSDLSRICFRHHARAITRLVKRPVYGFQALHAVTPCQTATLNFSNISRTSGHSFRSVAQHPSSTDIQDSRD